MVSRIVLVGKERLAMLWLCRSRGSEVMMDVWVRRWIFSVGDDGEARAMYVDMSVEFAGEEGVSCCWFYVSCVLFL